MDADLLHSLAAHLAPWSLAITLVGVALGVLAGALPGLNGGTLMVLTLPMTFYMASGDAQTLLISMYVGGVAGGFITTILIGIPGEPSSIVTRFDGYPMAQQGKAERALALAIVAGFGGAMIAWLFLALLSAPLARIALRFGPFEYFALIVMALVLVSSVSGRSLLKGLIAALLGILANIPGLDPISADPRLTFGLVALEAGFENVPVLIGAFAVAQILSDVNETGADRMPFAVTMRTVYRAFRGMGRHVLGIVRSAVIGTWIGILPGTGALVGSIVSYTVARNTSRTPERFGTGAEQGVIASEAGNNATVCGALVPMIAMGIPGSVADVILMAALVIHSIQPGPLLIQTHPDIFHGVIAAALVANVVMLLLLMVTTALLGRIMNVPSRLLFPFILVLCVVGTYAAGNRMFDLWVMLGFGAVGYAMDRAGFPIGPFVIGLVLAPLAETSLRSALTGSDGSFAPLFESPVALACLAVAAITFVWPVIRRRPRSADPASESAP